MLLQSSESVKELYTLLKEKLEASKKSPPEPEEAPSLDLGLHPVTVPSTPSTPTTPLWERLDAHWMPQPLESSSSNQVHMGIDNTSYVIKTDLDVCKTQQCLVWI